MKNYPSIRRSLQMLALSLALLITLLAVFSAKPSLPVPAPTFSAESGFYENAFFLELAVPEGCDVYYTLDSSIPGIHSLRYTDPIFIDNASLHENTYSMLPGMSAQPWGQAPDFLIDKCTVVRAIAVPRLGTSGENSQVITKSFFVGISPNQYDGFPVISLVSDPDNLFDHKNGIYVAGDLLNKYLFLTSDPWQESWQYWPANYWQTGQDSEREAYFTVFDLDGTILESKEIGIRIQGGWSRSQVPRSLNLYAREEYDGDPYFTADYFGNSYRPQSINLSVGGNQYVSRLNDFFVSRQVQGLPYSVMHYTPCVMFLDGEYWGFYWLTEKYDAFYIQNTYGLDTDDVIMIKALEVAEGNASDISFYDQLISFLSTHDMADPEYYAQACDMVDIDSCIDYFATLIYLARGLDWPNYNEALWRTREVTDAPYADGKWRWMLYDVNTYNCMTDEFTHHNTLEMVIEESPIFGSLWNNPSFRDAFQNRIMEIADRYFAAEEMIPLLDSYQAQMYAPLSRTWARFFGKDNTLASTFDWEIFSAKSFFEGRRAVVASWFDTP